MPNTDPVTAWKALKGVTSALSPASPSTPARASPHRASLAKGQKPTTALFGCGDSRVAAELIFDQGLGDMFVVRTAGHVIDSAVLGSFEFAVAALGVSVIVILGHDSCGAVKATAGGIGRRRFAGRLLSATWSSGSRRPFCWAAGKASPAPMSSRHATWSRPGTQLFERSSAIAAAVAAGELAMSGHLSSRRWASGVAQHHRRSRRQGRRVTAVRTSWSGTARAN